MAWRAVQRKNRASGVSALYAALMMGSAAGVASLAGIGVAQAQTRPSTLTFQVPRGPLGPALAAFGRQSGLQITYRSATAAGKTTEGFSGTATREQALTGILRGSGLFYSLPNATTVAISAPEPQAAASSGGDADTIQLDEIVVSGGTRTGVMSPDTPYETPGSVSHISQEQLSRLPPISPGDVFVNAPGVLNGGNRVGTSLNPNIRGLQGMGRVNTTIDGALNSSTSYRGYAGNRDESYVDPDMIGGVDISKGPSDGVGTGGIGGSINFRTLSAEDLVRDGENWGARFKGGIGSNTRAPLIRQNSSVAPPVLRDADRPSFFNNDSWSGSVATGVLQENFEGVFAFSKRRQGNYFAGKNNVPSGFIFPENGGLNPGRNAVVRPGDEIYNTSEDTDSLLAKGKFKWGDGQSFELGYMLYDSKAGEEDEALINIVTNLGQRQLSQTRLDTYTAKYRNAPSDNLLVNVRANLWYTDLEHKRGQAYPAGFRDHSMKTTGGDLSNRSVIDTAFGALTLDGGAEFRIEHAEAPDLIEAGGQTSRGPNGFRTLTSGFGKGSFAPTDWLEVSAGARLDYYEAEGEGVASIFPDRSDSRLSPNFGAVVTPIEGVQLFAQYKEGYRPPSLRELYWEIYNLQVNPDLKGEVSKGWEFGFNVLRDDVFTSGDKVRFKASYFRNRYDDYVIVQDVPGVDGQQQYTNIDRANYHGIELSGSYDTGTFFAEGAFTKYLKAEYCTPGEGCVLPRLDETLANVTPATFVPPDWSGSITAGVRLFDEALTLGGRAVFSSTRIGSDWPPSGTGIGLVGLNFTWPEFVVFDLFSTYKFNDDTSLNLSVENITDQYYYGPLASTGMPSPGRTARLGLTHRLGGAGFPLIPGLPSLGRASEGAPGDNWTGLYVGGHWGVASADVSGSVTTGAGDSVSPGEAADYSDDGRIGGAQIGYNHQFENKVVFGVEGDFSMLGQKGGTSRVLADEFPGLAAAGYLESETDYELDWTATLRGRLGYSFGRLMVYGTGGVGIVQQTGTRSQYRGAQATANPTSTEQYFSETDSGIGFGWTAGAGFEFAVANNWSLKGEYAFANFGGADLRFDEARGGVGRSYYGVVGRTCIRPPNIGCRDVYDTVPGSSDAVEGREAKNDAELHTVKIGLNYRF
ncbi:TonB-dependent receptor domain-containing protein [Terrihabitans sp. B22-R8]|uniref:TonB-dependent receptor domain-containing protein n=1 Tax=Terrihabitans sp. B22-R8 TaxID=3425128 RepID=UPI00403CAE37